MLTILTFRCRRMHVKHRWLSAWVHKQWGQLYLLLPLWIWSWTRPSQLQRLEQLVLLKADSASAVTKVSLNAYLLAVFAKQCSYEHESTSSNGIYLCLSLYVLQRLLPLRLVKSNCSFLYNRQSASLLFVSFFNV